MLEAPADRPNAEPGAKSTSRLTAKRVTSWPQILGPATPMMPHEFQRCSTRRIGCRILNKMPDLGLINQRYTMDLKGASQQLEIRTWGTVLRMAETIQYEWKPGEWYTMKMSVTLEDGRGIVHGKIWPRDSEEPAEWTLTAVDPSPNLTGAPGLWGITKDAEFYMDNITVTKN